MHAKATSGWLAALVVAVAAASCGDEDGFKSGVDGNKELGAVSAEEQEKLCKALNGFFEGNFRELGCRLAGVAAGAFAGSQGQMACQQAYDECVKAPSDPSSTTCRKAPPACKATVAEFESCMTDLGNQFEAAAKSIPNCSQLNNPSGGGGTPPSDEQPASCRTVRSKCPEWDVPELPD